MEKEFVPYDRALRLKKLGFDEPCLGYYAGDILCTGQPKEIHLDKDGNYKKSKTESYPIIASPTYSQSFRWFRENYDLHSGIDLCFDIDGNRIYQYEILIVRNGSYNNDIEFGEGLTYYEAELACLEKLYRCCEGIVIACKS